MEDSESDADKDAQDQMWNDKVLVGEGRAARFTLYETRFVVSRFNFLPRMTYQTPTRAMSRESSEWHKLIVLFFFTVKQYRSIAAVTQP